MKDLAKKYLTQKANAKRRGIGWNLTFEQWLEWWGDDIHKRGSGTNDLSMQRIADSGPYELGNIRKGFPRDNSATRSIVCANRRTERARELRERELDALLYVESKDPREECGYSLAEQISEEIFGKHWQLCKSAFVKDR